MAFPASFLRFLSNLVIIIHFSDSFGFSENAGKKKDNDQMSRVGKHVKYYETLWKNKLRSIHCVYYSKFSHWAYPSFG